MTVYVLSTDSHEDWTMLGIYSSLSRAEAAKAEFETPYLCDWMDDGDPPLRPQANPIHSIILDEKIDPSDWGSPNRLPESAPAPIPESER